jgi:hypothetical protein
MIWQNPWAWIGLIVLAVPVLVHLLGRRSARVQPFPTLQFLKTSRLLPVRRARLSDALLLAVRLAILAAAVAALAQPLLLTGARVRAGGRTLARAIVVDTSASMMRVTPADGRAVDAARQEAQRMAGEAGTSVILESAAPATTLAGAVAWLNTQPGRREVAIISDFQVGTLDEMDLAIVPPASGVRLTRIDVSTDSASIESVTTSGGNETVARIALVQGRTDVEWMVRGRSAEQDGDALLLLAGSNERNRAEAALAAALAAAAPPVTSGRSVAIVYPQYERRRELLRTAQPLDERWMADAIARLRDDATFATASSTADAADDATDAAPFAVVASTDAGRPVILAARGNIEGRDRLLLLSMADAGSLTSAALIAAVSRALSTSPPVRELEPATLSDAQLGVWQRSASAESRGSDADASDGKWFWLVALGLLAIETWLRRAPRADTSTAFVHERVG